MHNRSTLLSWASHDYFTDDDFILFGGLCGHVWINIVTFKVYHLEGCVLCRAPIQPTVLITAIPWEYN